MSANGDPLFYELRNALLVDQDAALERIRADSSMLVKLAAWMGKLATCRFLLNWGAAASFINAEGESVLAASVHSGRIEVVEAVLEHLDPALDINLFIKDVDAHMLNQIDSDITKLLRKRGLRPTRFERVLYAMAVQTGRYAGFLPEFAKTAFEGNNAVLQRSLGKGLRYSRSLVLAWKESTARNRPIVTTIVQELKKRIR